MKFMVSSMYDSEKREKYWEQVMQKSPQGRYGTYYMKD